MPEKSIDISDLSNRKRSVNGSSLRASKINESSLSIKKDSTSVFRTSYRGFGTPLHNGATPPKRTSFDSSNLERLVEAITKTLNGDEDENFNPKVGKQYTCINVDFDPDGCTWTATLVLPAAKAAVSSDSSFGIKIVCSEVEGDAAPPPPKAQDPGLPEGYIPHDSDSDSDEEEAGDDLRSYVVDVSLGAEDAAKNEDELPESFKETFDFIGFDIKKALVRCEMPEFPEGCKGKTFRELYQLNARLKSGSFATVCRGTHRATGRKVAIKCVLRKDLPPSDDAGIYDEVLILASLKHRYIVPLIDFFEEKECYFLVMELMSGGDLFDRIGKKKSYSERDARDLCRKMIEAVKFCHDNGIAHCDMKPKNLLLRSEEDDSFIKMADFGFATRVYTPKSLTKQCGTPFFVAPEILTKVPYDQASDMWSVGVIIYLLLSGDLPFMGRSQRELFRKIVIGTYEFGEEAWGDVSEDAKDLVRGLLVTDPAKRLTATEAMNSKWVMSRAHLLERNKLMHTSQRLKTFNARMKLRSAMIAVNWVSSARLLTRQMTTNMKKMEVTNEE
uniref:Protein kinase domain-containing protein n=1 Tax=Ditylum brightwellii TaxID=49249 RepID=A0A6U3VKJ7_9STRA|mmetsp:Transcript_8374/g.12506  ORF Transcript_8374/g.12506 Transcript_8374/m.12506 type:complete len:558 (+) Transcript_8374:166-1839(+)